MAGVKLTMTVPGLSQLGLVYRDAAAVKFPKYVSEALEPVAQAVLEEAKANAPRRTGKLASSMVVRPSGPVKWSVGGSRVKYFSAVHWGTGPRTGKTGPHNIAKRPFLWNAGQAHIPQMREAVQVAIDRLIGELE